MALTPHVFEPKTDRIITVTLDPNTITSIDKAAWDAELKLHAELFDKLKYHLPKELAETKAQLEKRLAA